jgi:hypothetical protein
MLVVVTTALGYVVGYLFACGTGWAARRDSDRVAAVRLQGPNGAERRAERET